MSQVDWQEIYGRYSPLVERVSTRSEFSDLMWEMQGELGTSHAYEMGGDYRYNPHHYSQGLLGASLQWDAEAGGYRIDDMLLGDVWDEKTHSPLAAPGIDVKIGDVIIAVNGQRVSEKVSPAQLLVNLANHEVLLTFAPRPSEPEETDQTFEDAIPEESSSEESSSEERKLQNRQYWKMPRRMKRRNQIIVLSWSERCGVKFLLAIGLGSRKIVGRSMKQPMDGSAICTSRTWVHEAMQNSIVATWPKWTEMA